ncbi:MAG: hypothetical protein FIB08_05725 [Candidatus Methanoperedens sp.]|nr:hypothetical protein [Candidatus Methanoperedens sp.]
MEKPTKLKNAVFMVLSFGFFYLGDIFTTFLSLEKGGHELNSYMASAGFNGFVLSKTILIAIVGLLVYYLDKLEFYRESGIIIGMVLMSGLLATLFNLGFYGAGS